VNYAEGILLGLVQGLTEFLPVSSSGHLVVAQAAVGLSTPGVLVEVVLHVATLLAVVIVYWARLVELSAGCIAGRAQAWRAVGLLLLASIPAGIVGILFEDAIGRAFDSLLLVGVNFLVTGAVLWSTRRVRAPRADSPGTGGAFAIGCAQALAIMPGISRSGTTVSAAMWLGIEPERAAEFSFLLALPAIAGAAVLQIPDLARGDVIDAWGPLGISFLTALVSGVVAIRFLVRLLRLGVFYRFAPYCVGIGIVTVAWALLR
jgi:undecaprenyl-diphosphatase